MPSERQREHASSRRFEVVTVRQPGSRYPTVAEASQAREKLYNGMSGRKVFLRFLFTFILMTLLGVTTLAFSVDLMPAASRDTHSAVLLILCVIGLVLGILMLLGSLVLGHYMMSNKLWRHLYSRDIIVVHRHCRSLTPAESSQNHDGVINQSDISFDPPDPQGAPPVYSLTAYEGEAFPLQDLSANHWLEPRTPSTVFILPSYNEAVNQKSDVSETSPPAYSSFDTHNLSQE